MTIKYVTSTTLSTSSPKQDTVDSSMQKDGDTIRIGVLQQIGGGVSITVMIKNSTSKFRAIDVIISETIIWDDSNFQ